MNAATFDPLKFFEELKDAGVSEAQARVQANAMRSLLDERMVTRDHLDARLRELELRLQKEIEQAKSSLLEWQIGIAVVVLTIMAKGFGWIGF